MARSSERPAASVAARLALLLGSTLLALLVCELLIRALGYGQPVELGPYFDRPLDYFTADLERRNPWAAGHDDVLKVAVVGDSFTVGESNHQYDAYPARLERLLNLNAGQRPAAVWVWANAGASTRAQLRHVQAIADWEPDVFILGIFLNDTEIQTDEKMRAVREAILPRVPEGWQRAILRRSALLGWMYQRLENRRSAQATIDYYNYIYHPEYGGYQAFVEAIGVFRRMSELVDAEFLPVIFPGLAATGDAYPLDFVHEAIHDVLDAEGLDYLDLREAFRHTLPVRMSAVPVLDPHPSEIAHRIAADAIFERLLDSGRIDEGYRPNNIRVRSEEEWLWIARRMENAASQKDDRD